VTSGDAPHTTEKLERVLAESQSAGDAGSMDLAALEEIRQLKYRYLRCVDLKRWEELADTLTPGATADYGTLALGQPVRLTGRDEIVAFLRGRLGQDIITVHFASQPEIVIEGAAASGTWCFEDTVIATGHRVMIKGAAFYEDRYAWGEDGRWRISHTGYVRTYEAMLSLDDLPSLRFTANRWAAQPAWQPAGQP
jgi:SnoaL-like domain